MPLRHRALAVCVRPDDNISRRVTFLVYTVDTNRVHPRTGPSRVLGSRWALWDCPRQARRGGAESLAFSMDRAPDPLKEDERQTRRDLRAALIFGIVAATIELGVILYFFW